MIVSLHDAQVAADEDEFARPFCLVAENFADAFAHLLLHFVGAFSGFFASEAVAYRCRRAFISAFYFVIPLVMRFFKLGEKNARTVGPHQSCGRELGEVLVKNSSRRGWID